MAELEAERRIIFRYAGPVRDDAPEGNPNGSRGAIAGIINTTGNVLGLMPHPERATDPQVDGTRRRGRVCVDGQRDLPGRFRAADVSGDGLMPPVRVL